MQTIHFCHYLQRISIIFSNKAYYYSIPQNRFFCFVSNENTFETGLYPTISISRQIVQVYNGFEIMLAYMLVCAKMDMVFFLFLHYGSSQKLTGNIG